MNELSDLMPQPLEYTIGGRALKFSPLTIGDLAALGQYLRSLRLKDYRSACEGLDPVIIAAGIESIIKSDADIDMRSPDAVRFLAHRSLSRLQPEMTLEAAGELLEVASMKEVIDIINTLGGATKN